MLVILSPAKNMRVLPQENHTLSKPFAPDKTKCLAALLKTYSVWQIESLMKINPDLALKAFTDFQNFDWEHSGSAALLAYHGLCYQNLNAQEFTPDDFTFAGQSLRILSAFYGLLRPADGISPYRLELQCKLTVDGGDLYTFWGDTVYQELFSNKEPVINLASNEYSRAVTRWLRPGDQLITCNFMTVRHGKLTTLATAAKMARGQMARYIVKNRIESPEGLKSFDWNGYTFQPHLSGETNYIFTR